MTGRRAKSFLEIDAEEWRRVMSVNLDGVFYGTREAVRVMKAHGSGSIINISSQAANRASPHNGPYAVAKSGVNNLTQTLAVEMAPLGIRVNTIAPGLIDTPIYGEGEEAEAFKNHLGQSVLFPKRLDQRRARLCGHRLHYQSVHERRNDRSRRRHSHAPEVRF